MVGIAFVTFLVACMVWFAVRLWQEYQRQPVDIMDYPLETRLMAVHMRAAQRKAKGALG